eukprot:SAG31_NODE_13221_length_884_cov_2.582166_1_plen_183_part_00
MLLNLVLESSCKFSTGPVYPFAIADRDAAASPAAPRGGGANREWQRATLDGLVVPEAAFVHLGRPRKNAQMEDGGVWAIVASAVVLICCGGGCLGKRAALGPLQSRATGKQRRARLKPGTPRTGAEKVNIVPVSDKQIQVGLRCLVLLCMLKCRSTMWLRELDPLARRSRHTTDCRMLQLLA